MDLQSAVRNVLSNYANFNGRARRSEYWYWVLAVFLLSIVGGIIDAIIGTQVVGYLILLAVLVPNLAVGARRLHDTDKSGWLQLIGIIPILGAIVLIVFFVQDSGPDNKYGPNPKGGAAFNPNMPPPAA